MHHKRKLNFKSFRNNVEGNIWSLFWYGKILFKEDKSRFYIEAYFALTKKDNFYLNNLDVNTIEKLEFPFTKSILFPLSSQFDFEGKFLKMSNFFSEEGEAAKNGLYLFENVSLNNKYNFRVNELEKLFSNCFFPEVFEKSKSIYLGAPYFIRKREFNTENKRSIINYIIPIDVVLKYFFGYSSLLLDLLITDRLKYAIFYEQIDKDSGRYKLYYNSKFITRLDANFIAKYYFTKDGFAEKLFIDIGAHFSKIKLNNDKNGSFIKFRIPFELDCRFNFVGQYFSKKDENSNTTNIIVNEILDIVTSDDFFLTTDKIDLIDINSSLHLDEEQVNFNDQGTNHIVESNPIQEELIDDLPVNLNSSDSIENIPVLLRKNFLQSPEINNLILSKNKNDEKIFLSDKRPNEHPDFQSYEGLRRRKIINISNVNWIEILEEAVQMLVLKYGYKEIRLSNRIDDKLYNKIIIQLIYRNVSYYIVDFGGNNYFPLFRNSNKNEMIDYEVINQIIEVIKNSYKSSWIVVSNKKSLKAIEKFLSIQFLENNDICFLRNNTHELLGETNDIENLIQKTIENLANKIHKKIITDFNSIS